MNLRSQIFEYLRRNSETVPLDISLEPEPTEILFLADDLLCESEKELLSKIQKASALRSLAISKDFSQDELIRLLESLKPRYLVSLGSKISRALHEIPDKNFLWFESVSLGDLQKSSQEKKKLWDLLKNMKSKKL